MASDGGETAPAPPPRDMVADRYRITGRLGRGGMGTVWQATDDLLRRQVAIKELHLPGEGLTARQIGLHRERALQEARTAALIRHPHVVVVHDVVEHQGHPWIVMELVDGHSLAHILERDGPLPPREAARVGAAVAAALAAAHEHGVQHRDVKPANVLVEHGSGRVVLTDFGIARMPGSATISETGAFVGSPEYTAPERMSGRGDGPASDLWSLGALLCAAVHGESPFRRDSIGEVVHAVAIDDFTPPRELGPLLPVATGLLDRDPARRMGSAEACRLLLAFAESGEEPAAPAAGLPPPVPAAPGLPQALSAGLPPGGSPPPGPAGLGTAEWEGAPGVCGAAVPDPPVTVLPGPAGPPSHRAAGRRRGGGVLVGLVTALVVLAVGTGGLVAFLAGRQGSGGGSPAARAVASPPPMGAGYPPPMGGNGPPIPPPDGFGPPPGAPGTPPFPPGFHLVADPAGFSVVLPGGYVRADDPSGVSYWSADRAFHFEERERPPDPGGAYGSLRLRHLAGPETYEGYRDGVVTGTREHGRPAALWEFTYDDGDGARRAFELCWTEDGRMYDISLSAPVARVEQARGAFDTARATFRGALWAG